MSEQQANDPQARADQASAGEDVAANGEGAGGEIAGEASAARIEAAVAKVLADGARGADLGGTMGTVALGDAVVAVLNG